MERRKPLSPKSGLSRTVGLKRTSFSSLPGERRAPPPVRKPLPVRKPMKTARAKIKARSAKMSAVYVQRRKLVERLLAAKPWCEACHQIAPLVSPSTGYASGVLTVQASVDVHEMLTRGRSGNTAKAILDEANCLCVCRRCHDWIEAHPAQARSLGLVKNSWDPRSPE